MCEKLNFIWKRPDITEYPKVWHTFKARDIDSDNLIEYRIQDLPKSRADEAFKHMWSNYIQDEPIGQALGGGSDPQHFEDYKLCWIPMVEQRMPLVCFRSGSDEIVGANFTFVISEEDDYMHKCYERFNSQVTRDLFDIVFLLFENFDPYKHYGVTEYLTSFGLSVGREYRGRGIGDHFLYTRKLLCKEFDLKFSQTIFTSDFSNRNADKVGFTSNVAISYNDVLKSHPRFNIGHIKSSQMTLKTLFC